MWVGRVCVGVQVEGVRMPRRRDGRRQGIAFVQLKSSSLARAALLKHGVFVERVSSRLLSCRGRVSARLLSCRGRVSARLLSCKERVSLIFW